MSTHPTTHNPSIKFTSHPIFTARTSCPRHQGTGPHSPTAATRQPPIAECNINMLPRNLLRLLYNRRHYQMPSAIAAPPALLTFILHATRSVPHSASLPHVYVRLFISFFFAHPPSPIHRRDVLRLCRYPRPITAPTRYSSFSTAKLCASPPFLWISARTFVS
jgi:hypothetical protein